MSMSDLPVHGKLRGKPIYLMVEQDPTMKLSPKLLLCVKQDEIQLRNADDMAKELSVKWEEITSVETTENYVKGEQFVSVSCL
jgi:CTP synthase (UTP-ammonia lyase)